MTTAAKDNLDRRPLKTRQKAWAQALAARFARWGVAPNAISLASIAFAAVAAGALVALVWIQPVSLRALLLVIAAASMQLRLLCNMLDGLVAVEGGRRSPVGDLYNEIPDRLADLLILASAGYAAAPLAWSVELGWACAAAALLTAYVRALGRSLGTPSFFVGPMAKPHRMAALTLATLTGAAVAPWHMERWILWAALILILAGCVITLVRRIDRIAWVLKHS